MLDLEVTLSSLCSQKWEIRLGAPFCHCVAILKQFDTEIKDIHIWYGEQDPLQREMAIKLNSDGIKLVFDTYSQCLKMIEVFDMDKVSLKSHGTYFNSPTVTPTIDQIHQSFGSTIPCKKAFDQNRQVYEMNYKGLSFTFTTDSSSEQLIDEGIGYHKVQLPPGINPKVHKMCIYHGRSKQEAVAPEIPLSILSGTPLLKSAEVIRPYGITDMIKLTLILAPINSTESDEQRLVQRYLKFEMTCQDVASEIGAPSKIFYKGEDKMKIHLPDHLREAVANKSDYIYNYFSLGLDVVFDGDNHTAKKFVLHTNYPGHYDFNMYMRCPFVIPLQCDSTIEHRLMRPNQDPLLSVTPYTKWNDIEQFYYNGPADKYQTPVVLRRFSSVNSNNPFSPPFCYGIQDMVFEVMKNRHIASVIIYQMNS